MIDTSQLYPKQHYAQPERNSIHSLPLPKRNSKIYIKLQQTEAQFQL